MKTRSIFLVPALVLGIAAASPVMLTGCEEQGPAEKAGENVDEAVQDTKRSVEDATD